MTSYGYTIYKSFRTTLVKHNNIIIFWCNSYLLTPLFNTRKQKRSFKRISDYGSFSSYIYSTTGCRIFSIIIHYFRWYVHILFLFWYRISWSARYDWYCFLGSWVLTLACLPSNRKPSSRFGIGYTLLTLCRRSLTFSVYLSVLLGILVCFK